MQFYKLHAMNSVLKQLLAFKLLIYCVFGSSPDPVFGEKGMVVSTSKQASQAGIQILKSGGNAIDAAVAVGFALAVTSSGNGNIGGGGFLVAYKIDGTTFTIDHREVAPSNSSKDMFLDDSLNVIPGKSWSTSLASGVPGSVAGMWMAHEKFGSKPWFDIIRPSIHLAQYGFNLDPLNTSYLNSNYYLSLIHI